MVKSLFAKKIGKQSGFTLIEVVVASGVFAVAVSAALGTYLTVLQLDGKSRSERSVQQNARFIMDLFAKEIRNGSINYAGVNNSTQLSLINQLDQTLNFQWDSDAKVLLMTKVGIGTTQLNSQDVRVTNFSFTTRPAADPFDLGNNTHVQPHVTIIMRLESTNSKVSESATMNLQSTFTVREYPSRQ